MGSRISSPLRGLAFLDPDYGATKLNATDSTYTEADPRPGSSTTTDDLARSEPQVLGAQSAPLTFIGTRAGGFPGVGDVGGGVAYYMSDGVEAVSDARHHRAAMCLTDAYGFDVHTAPAVTRPWVTSCAAFPLSGYVLAAPHISDTATVSTGWVWSPETGLWTATANMPSGSGALAVIPGTDRGIWVDERNGVAYYTDDHGATWAVRGYFQKLRSGAAYDYNETSRSLAFDGGGQLLFVGVRDDGSDSIDLYTSPDVGLTWSLAGAVDGKFASAAAHPSGTIALVYVDASDNLQFFSMGAAGDVPTASASIEIDGDDLPVDCAVACDDDGVIWVYYMVTSTGPVNEYLRFAVSYDGGTTWQAAASAGAGRRLAGPDVMDSSGTAYPAGLSACASMGHVFLILGAAEADVAYAPVALTLGGWQGPMIDITTDVDTDTIPRDPANRIGTVATTAGALVWWPCSPGTDLSGIGYALTTTGGSSEAHTAGGVAMTITTATNTYYYSDPGHGGTDGQEIWRYCLTVEDDGGGSANDIMTFLDGSQHDLQIIHTETSFYVYDVDDAAQIGAAVAVTSGARLYMEVMYDDGTGVVTICYREGPGTDWTSTTRTLTGSHAAAGAGDFGWGIVTPGALGTEVRWYYMAVPFANSFGEPELLAGREGWGKPVPGAYPYPIPDIYDAANDRVGRLAMRGGPLVRHETYTHDVAPDYPVENLFPDIEPSPAARWRSVDKATQMDIAVDLGDEDSLVAGAFTWLVPVVGANVRSVVVQGKAAGGSYSTLGTIDLATGFAAMNYALAGNVLRPASGTTGARYIWPGELRGGHVILDPGGTPIVRTIRYNTGGLWSADDAKASIILDGIDGTEGATGDVDIVWPSGVMAIHRSGSSAPLSHLLFRIATTELAAEAYYEVGMIAPFGLAPTGKVWSDGWEWDRTPNTRIDADSRRSERRSQLGPNQRRLTLSWDDGFIIKRLRAATSPDYVADSAVDQALVARDEVWQALWEWLDLSAGASRPVLWCGDVPADGVTLTDPTLWLYGFLSPQGIRVQQSTGDEGVDEFMRASGIEIVEAV